MATTELDEAPVAGDRPSLLEENYSSKEKERTEMDKKRLGFLPQKELVYSRLLPYFSEQLDAESVNNFALIKSKLGESVLKSEMRPAFVYWLAALSRHLQLYGLQMTKEDHLCLVRLLFELCVDPEMDLSIVGRVANTLTVLIKKRKLLSREDLVIDWKPLFALYERVTDNRYQRHRMMIVPQSLVNSVRNLVRACRAYFSVQSTEEMLDLWSPLVCPYLKMSMQKAMANFQLFLPTLVPPESHDKGFKLWLDEFLGFWESFQTAPAWETYLMWLFSRLAQDNIGHIDWEPYVPAIFSRLLRSFQLPNGFKDAKLPWPNDCFDVTAAANFVTALMGGGGSCQRHLDVLFNALESYCHPSNIGMWNLRVNKFLSKLPETVVKRLHRERNAERTWVAPVPPSHRLSDDDVTKFVSSMMGCVLLSMFGKIGCLDAALALKNLAILRPEIAIPPLLERLYPALETLTEPHRLTATLQCVTCTLRELVRGGKFLPDGPSHVLPVLSCCLPGIDPNDCKKTLVTFQLIEHMATLVPLVDCSQAAHLHPELTETELEVCLSTRGFEDFVLQFLDRCFVVVDSCSTEPQTYETNEDASMNPEEKILQEAMVATFNTIVNQSSPEIYKSAVSKLHSFVSGRIFGCGAAGKIVAKLCGAATIRDDPEEGLKTFLPPVCRLILALTSSEEVSAEKHLGNEILFNLLLFSELVAGSGGYLMPYRDSLLEVLKRAVWLSSHEGHGIACGALSNLMLSLSAIYFTEQRSVPWKLDRPLAERLPVKDWGSAGDLDDLNVSWHVPSSEEVAFLQLLADEFLATALDRLNLFCAGEKNMSRDEVKHCLKVLHHCLRGALPLCPKFKGPYENCVESCVEMAEVPCTAVVENYELTVNGADVREAAADTMHRLTGYLLAKYEDNTAAFKSILKIDGLLIFYRGVGKDDYGRRMKGFNSIKKVLEDRLTGRKRHLRSLLLQRVQLLHELRVLESGRMGMTATVATILTDLVALSTSRYREVRVLSQRLLQECLDCFPYSYLRVLPAVLPFFRKDPSVGEVQMKGALHLVMGSLLTKRDWRCLSELWPAVLAIQHYEKPSTSRLLDASVARIGKCFQTFAIRLTVPESARATAVALWDNAPVPGTSRPTPDEEDDGVRAQTLRSDENLRNYEGLVSSLTTLMADGNLNWQNHQLCFEAIGYLIRHDVSLPAPAVRCVLNGLVHEALAVRKLAIGCAVGVLMQQKPTYVRRQVEREPPAGPPRTPCGFLTAYRADNGWLQYGEGRSRCEDRSRWEGANFVHKHYVGFCSWPTRLEVYGAADEQPPLDRDAKLLSEAERAVRGFFSDEENVDRLLRFLSLEDQKGKDKFNVWRSTMFKGIFRNFGDEFVGVFLPHLRKLVADPRESHQRCAAEMMCGLTRGCKRWPFDKVAAVWELMVPLWKDALSNVTAETKGDWSYCVGLATSHRDPRSIPWLLELLADGLLLPSECQGSFLEASRIHMMCSALENQSWRTAEFAVAVLDRIVPLLSHPYQNIRKDLSRILAALFKLDLNMANGSSPPGPKVEKFVSRIVPLLQDLHSETRDGPADGDGDNGGSRAFNDPKWKAAASLLKTVSGWISHHMKKCPQMKTEAFVPLVPLLLKGEGTEQDPELQRECLLAMALMSQASLRRVDLETIMSLLVQVLVFSNLFTVLRSADFVRRLAFFVSSLLADVRLEVREMAAVTLSGLLHCRVIDSSDDVYVGLMAEVNEWAGTPIKGPSSVTAEPQRALVRRHAGVLGLCALVRAHPYDICDGLPDVLMTIADHLRDPPPIQGTVRATLSDFRRTHHDCWQQHKQRFTDDQLAVLADLLVSPNYYA